MNLSLNTATVPDDWKVATVTPIPKVNGTAMVSELRPISILPLPGKILEHLIHDDYYENLTAENLLSNNQFGFQPSRCTSDAIAQLIYYIGMGFNNSLCTVATFIDFAKAFDTLNHTRTQYCTHREN